MRPTAILVALAACAHSTTPAPTPKLPACTVAPEPQADLAKLAGVKIARVDVRGVGLDGISAANALKTKPGTELDADTLRDDVRALWKMYAWSQIAVTAEPTKDGYAIEVSLTPPPRVRAVEIDGMRRGDLAPLVILEGTLHDAGRLKRLADAATAWWRAHGYLHAEISATTRPDCDARTVVVHVDASLGQRYTLARLDVVGSVLPLASFERELGAFNRVGGWYREDMFIEDLSTLVERHRAAGYLDVGVEKLDSHADDKTGTIVAFARLKAGERFKLGVLEIEGGTLAQRAVVERELGPMRGIWYDGDAITAADARMDVELYDLGAYAASTATSHEHGLAKMTITLQERTK